MRSTRLAMAAVVLALLNIGPDGPAARRAGAADTPAGTRPDLPANRWVCLERAALTRPDSPLVYEPQSGRFMVLGGSIGWQGYLKPHPYDDLALDLAGGQWENLYPQGKAWGPRFGEGLSPGWKSESWGLLDVEGNVRPNLATYLGVWYYNQYALDTDTHRVYFYARGTTFGYDPASRTWKNLASTTHPDKALGGGLLWGSMCYAPHIRKVVLFGGGNVNTPRGDPGTWLYDPADNTWRQLELDRQPPQRALSPMVYDPVNRKVVLFGGDQLNQLISDTWTFDGQRWEQCKPAVSPAPRGGHAMVWLPKAKKVLLLGGFGYGSDYGYYPTMYVKRPLDAWTYDAAADKWEFLASWDRDCPASYNTSWIAPYPLRAAADNDDVVVAVGMKSTWLCQLGGARPDPEQTARLGVKPGMVERRTGFYDPDWYRQKAGPGDPAKVAAELAALAGNTWALRPAPNRPEFDVCWGTAAFAPETGQIMRFSGGHCVYSGTAPVVYDTRTDRWSIPFAPEMPLDYCASNGLVPGEWSFAGNPWMLGHTYNGTDYDPVSRSLVLVKSRYTYFFDPAAGRWSHADTPNPFQTSMYVTTLCPTPKGVVAWVGNPGYSYNLFLLDGKTRQWTKLPLTGNLPAANADCHSMAYDSKRDRLLIVSGVDPQNKGDVLAYDMATGQARWLGAAGKAKAAVPARESVYIPELDAVLLGQYAAGEGGRKAWLLYDCQKNAWLAVEFAGADPLAKTSHYSLAVMHDAKRKLLWATDHVNRIYVLKLDPGTLAPRPLE